MAALGDPRNPAVLGLIHNVARFGDENAIPVSLCGDAGGDPQVIPSLLAAGLRALSVTPAQLPLARPPSPARARAMAPRKAQETPEELIRAYKLVLSKVLEARPSGTRQRLADALGKHRSFITQMTSPAYPTPIPQRHLATLLSVCHFGPAERDAFMGAYRAAHQGKLELGDAERKTRHLSLLVPDLGDDKSNGALDKALGEFVQKLSGLMRKGGDE